jgi:hypothetical protein
MGNVFFLTLKFRKDVRGKNEKNCLPKMEGENVHCR